MIGTFFSVVWPVVGVVIFLTSFITVAWLDGRGEIGGDDKEGMFIGALILAALWPGFLVAAVVVSPFVGLYCFVKRLAEKKPND